ncbi:hemerythrin domain-containing protein, partial [Nocardioides sp. Root79]|uniref:hemerythrin domain-containing protein n=2 Tax=unclassified Nocardioides TaxID=2615069 RepID=UPI001CEC081A
DPPRIGAAVLLEVSSQSGPSESLHDERERQQRPPAVTTTKARTMTQTTMPPLMLPGQAAAPAGPADMTMMYVLHHAFRRDLADFVAAAQRTPAADRAAWQRLGARWTVFGELLHDHHTKEDDYVWPLLVGKVSAAGDAEALQVLEDMEEEHASIDPLMEACSDGFDRLSEAADEDARASLVVRLVRTQENLDGHLAHEEKDAIQILQKYVNGNEWAELEKTKLRGGMSLAQVKTMVPWVYKGLAPQAAAQVDRVAGPPFRVIHALGRRKFARGERAAFGG